MIKVTSMLALIASASSFQFDALLPVMLPPYNCENGCAVWSDLAGSFSKANQTYVNSLWADSAAQKKAGNNCAIPANFGVPENGLCYCAGTSGAPVSEYGYCNEPFSYPQQINLQFGKDNTELQVGFVTVDNTVPLSSDPIVEICLVTTGSCVNRTGTATRLVGPQNSSRVQTFSFVKFPALTPSAQYKYRCIAGVEGAQWSEWITFTAPNVASSSRFAIYGDQGLYPYSSLGNLLDGMAKLDFIVHAGGKYLIDTYAASILFLTFLFQFLADLAYNLLLDDGHRGDGYFNALERILSKIPMIFTIGNHVSIPVNARLIDSARVSHLPYPFPLAFAGRRR
jgi:Purple acid Phosphatase, N-terminal domain